MKEYIAPELLQEIEDYMGQEKEDIALHYLRSYKAAQAICVSQNYNFVLNSNGSFLNHFFLKLTGEILGKPNELPFMNLNVLGMFFKFLIKQDPISFQAFWLVYNMPYNLASYMHHANIREVLSMTLQPTTSFCDHSNEALLRYVNYCKMSGFLFDLSAQLYTGQPSVVKKSSINYKPMYLGEINKVISAGGSGAALETRDLPAEEVYTVVEERKKLKTDVDLIMKHFGELAKRKNVLFRMRSTMNFSIDKRLGFEVEKARFPEIFKKLQANEDNVVFVDYHLIKDIEIYPKLKAGVVRGRELRSRSPDKLRVSRSPVRMDRRGRLEDSRESERSHRSRRSLQGRSV